MKMEKVRNTKEKIDALKRIKYFLLDMDGTFYLENKILEGSLEFLEEIKKRSIKTLFLTNNSSKPVDAYLEKLKNMGAPEEFLNVITSGDATLRFAKQHYPNKKAYLLANQIVSKDMLAKDLLVDLEDPDYVILTYDTELDYHKLDRICYFIRQGLPYIASHPDLNCPMSYGFAPDIGATIAYIKASTGRLPDKIIGKPNAEIINDGLEVLGAKREEVAMVGDRLYTDVEAAIQNGLLGILVLSGETDLDMLAASDIKPDLVYDSLLDIIDDL